MTEQTRPLDAIFLHVPRFRGERREIMVLPTGLPALANLLADEGRQVELVHLGIESDLGSRSVGERFSLRRHLEARDPRLVLISMHWNQQVRPVIDVAQRVRGWLPEARIVLGGLTASVFAEDILGSLPFVDAVVRGDGEEPLRLLARVWLDGRGSLSEVPNLLWRDREGAVHRNDRTWVLDEATAGRLRHGDLSLLCHHAEYLERALYADFSQGTDVPRGYARAAYLNAGRGCPRGCLGCGGSGVSQWETSRRLGSLLYPLEKILRDVREVRQLAAEVLRTSFEPPGSQAHILSWYRAIAAEGLDFRLITDLWELPTVELLETIHSCFSGGAIVILSPETGSETVRAKVRSPGFTNDALVRGLLEAEARGLETHCFFSAGLPGESRAQIDETARLIERVRRETKAGVSVTPMTVDPASPLWLEPDRFGVRVVRRGLADFYDERGLPGGPGYETEEMTEGEILDACNGLLAVAGLPPI
jgi:radical SAM superfamily enzyme YgiQ (UPF0313 family)